MALALGAGAAHAQDKVVNVYNWSDYIDPKVLDEFTKETGIKVVYDTYDNNEIVETKLLAGKSGYDIVVPSGPFLQRLAAAGVFQKLDKAKLPNLKNQWPEIAERLAVFDPGNAHAVNYMWGTTGIGYNVAKAKERLGDEPIDSWDIVLKPENSASSRTAASTCWSRRGLFPGVLGYLGLNPNSTKPADLHKAADAECRRAQVPLVRVYQRARQRRHLPRGRLFRATSCRPRSRAEEAKNGVEVAYVIPREGALMWFDSS